MQLELERLKKAIAKVEETHDMELVDGYSGDIYIECEAKNCRASRYDWITDHLEVILETYIKLGEP